MKLTSISLENFRRYRSRCEIPIDPLTAFIGKNDAGKSTILEALDIFFEGGAVQISPGDACVAGESGNVRIAAVFEGFPAELNLDAGALTTLAAEYLLNAEGRLEIIKVFNCGVVKVGAPKIYARAMHPSADGFSDLLSKKLTDLKKIVKDRKLEANCHQNSNPSMRRAIFADCPDLKLILQDVQLNEADGKVLWDAIKRSLPVFSLFRADRINSDQDAEVQNPMSLAVKKALADLAPELEGIAQRVAAVATETAERTLEQLRTTFPEMNLANVLTPKFRKPSWSNIFKLDLESDDGIPLDKRGSGVRRLILLSFFKAEAERRRKEREEGEQVGVPVIYAIEEPETSQHPGNQREIIVAFQQLANSGDQLILTTHTPALGGLLPVSSLRFIDTDPITNLVRCRTGSDDVFFEIAESLGVLPDANVKANARVAVAVEGPTDIDALISLADVLSAAGRIPPLDHEKIFWTIGGGQTLQDWVERKYLDRLGLPQVFLFDSDRTSDAEPLAREKADRLDQLQKRERTTAFVTRKRMIENYCHLEAIKRTSNGKIAIPPGIDVDFVNLNTIFGASLAAAKHAHGNNLGFYPKDASGGAISLKTQSVKRIITSFLMRQMTAEEVLERGSYTPPGSDVVENEIIEWMAAIQKHLL